MPELPDRPGRRHAAAVVVLLVVAAGAAVLNGFTMFTATGTCYTRTITCHGVPVDGCLGYETSSLEYVDAARCPQLSNITARCRQACTSPRIQDWRSVRVYDRSCGSWDRTYGLNVSCPD